MNPKNIFISIEGIDGVGKTTVAQLLAGDGSYQYYKSPGSPFTELRKEVDTHATPLERYCFYRLATQFDSEQIRRLLEEKAVVCDRYIASTAAYHIAMDARIEKIHSDATLLKPDFAFLLGARSDVRDQRIYKRAQMLSDAKFERDSAFLDSVAQAFMSFDLIYIDTSDMTAEEVATEIRRVVAQGGRS